MTESLLEFELGAPLGHGPQGQDGHHGHAEGGADASGEESQRLRYGTFAMTLKSD